MSDQLPPLTNPLDPMGYTLDELTAALAVCVGLSEAYEKGEANGGSIDWEDLDRLHEIVQTNLHRMVACKETPVVKSGNPPDGMESSDSIG